MMPPARWVLAVLAAGVCTPAAATRARVAAATAARFRSVAAARNSTTGFGAKANVTGLNGAEAVTINTSNHSGPLGDGPLHALAAQNRSTVTVTKPKHKLRICNAYPDRGAIDVFHGEERLTNTPMEYKDCQEFISPVKVGDKLKFEVDGVRAGHFAVSDLPEGDAVLVLVVFRHDTRSQAVAFESHVFANLINAQIAVLDAYRGPAGEGTTPAIRDKKGEKQGGSRVEALHYDSVVAVNPGVYEVVLQGSDGHIKAKKELVALNRESYIVVRCGVDPHAGQEYTQELIVFPHSDAKVLTGSGSASMRGVSLLAAGVAMLAALPTIG